MKSSVQLGLVLLLSFCLGFKLQVLAQEIAKLNDKDWIIIIISSLIGGIIAFGLVVLVQWLQEPNIIFSVGTEAPDRSNNPPKWKIIHVKIKNYPKKFKLSPITVTSAFSVKGRVTLRSTLESRSFFGKWSSTPQPMSVISIAKPQGVAITQVTDPNKALIPSREDIYPSRDDAEAVELAIGIKFEGESEFYGFSNESYLDPNLKNSGLKFDGTHYRGTLLLSGGGLSYRQDFEIINNSSSINNFHLNLQGNSY